jgi:hypothetical protein
MRNENKNKSNFFNFKKKFFCSGVTYSFYQGWSSLILIKCNMKKNKQLGFNKIIELFPKIKNKEKFLIITNGKIKNNLRFKKKYLIPYDVINSFSNFEKLEIKSQNQSEFFIISAKTKGKSNKKIKLFNIKKDVKPKNLWGGKCISRPYAGKNINIVLFDLKKGFEFKDSGHVNEQITWLNKGEMNFYSGRKNKKLKINQGIDIGCLHKHGGISKGAIGFDAFFPKRKENKYKNSLTK